MFANSESEKCNENTHKHRQIHNWKELNRANYISFGERVYILFTDDKKFINFSIALAFSSTTQSHNRKHSKNNEKIT